MMGIPWHTWRTDCLECLPIMKLGSSKKLHYSKFIETRVLCLCRYLAQQLYVYTLQWQLHNWYSVSSTGICLSGIQSISIMVMALQVHFASWWGSLKLLSYLPSTVDYKQYKLLYMSILLCIPGSRQIAEAANSSISDRELGEEWWRCFPDFVPLNLLSNGVNPR